MHEHDKGNTHACIAHLQALNDENDTDAENNPTDATKTARVACPAISSNLHLSHGLDPFEIPPLGELTDERLADCLKSAFGYGGFKGQQLEVVRRVLEGESTLAVLPTGKVTATIKLGQTPKLLEPAVAAISQLARTALECFAWGADLGYCPERAETHAQKCHAE